MNKDGGTQHSAIGSHSGGNTDNNALIFSNSVSSSGVEAGMIFKTGETSGYANATERMRITPAGNIGIGTTSPSAPLHIYTTSTSEPSLLIENDEAQAPADAIIRLLSAGGSDTWIDFIQNTYGQLEITGGGSTRRQILTVDDPDTTDACTISFNKEHYDWNTQIFGDSSTPAIFVEGGNSNVGIGTASPSTKLQVSGTVTATAFAGALTGNVTGNVSGSSGSTTGNAATATTLATARNIAGQSFNGSASITIATGDLSDIAGLKDEDDMASDSATHIATQQSIKAYVDAQTSASTVTVSDSTANTNFPVVFHNESNGLLDDTGALRYNPSTGTLLVPNLSVAGTTTQVNTVTMNAANAVVFEGATPNDHETTLTITDPTADRTITLPNASGTVLLSGADVTLGDILVDNNGSIKANGSGYLQLGNTNNGLIRILGTGSISRIRGESNSLQIETNRDNDDIIFAVNAGGTDSDETVVEAMRIVGSDGNVGIGTTSPVRPFHVVGDAYVQNGDILLSRGNFYLQDASDATKRGSFTSDGVWAWENVNVGIGTTSPANTLHVNSGGSNGVAKFESTDNMASIAIAIMILLSMLSPKQLWKVLVERMT